MEFNNLRPLIAPISYFEHGNFPAPHYRLVTPDLCVTWVELTDDGAMLYVTSEQADVWKSNDVDWSSAGMSAMRQADEGGVYTHEMRTEQGELAWIAMMHEDGLGSSRLLCQEELQEIFPEGYCIALPDRSCGIAVSQRLQGEALDEVRDMIKEMHMGATTPMLPDLLKPEMLLPRQI